MGILNKVFLIIFCLLSAFLVKKVSKFITVSPSVSKAYPRQILEQLGTSDNHLFVFIQITDLHISVFTSKDRYEQLKDFCRSDLQVIKPKVVIASGDLTNAINWDKIIATQFEEEWKLYHRFQNSCRTESGISNWLDMRGNHDNFNVDGFNSSMSFYPKYGARNDSGSYMAIIHEPNNTKYAFVAVDATLEFGPKRILNFVGDLTQKKLKELKEYQQVIENSNVNASFWFGHYPSSSLLSAESLRKMASKSIAYFCGHYHTWIGMVPRMYSSHHSGMLELELADWKDQRMYRIAVMDHGLFSFADVQHNKWPAVVVLNPKPLITVQPSKEPFYLVANSTHIRLLIYSPSEITICELKIDNGQWVTCQLTGKSNPLFTAPWNPTHYANGLHTLDVRAKDKSGLESLTRTEFALDGRIPTFPVLARLALMYNITTIGKSLFGFLLFMLIAPLCYFRLEKWLVLRRKFSPRKPRGVFCRGLRIFANLDFLFFTITLYSLYLVALPWYVGDLIDGKIGVVFIWGAYFGHHFLPGAGALTYYYGVFHLLTFNLPLILLLAQVGNSRYGFIGTPRSQETAYWKEQGKLPLLCFLAFQLCVTVVFTRSYGWMATIANPFRTWAIFLTLYLWNRTNKLQISDFKDIAKVLM